MAKTAQGKVVLYTADQWEHVCPMVRVIGPYREIGWEVIPGICWEAGGALIVPERVLDADVVVIQRDFPRYTKPCEQIVELARGKNKLIVYDLDDLLTEVPKVHPDSEYYRCARVPILRAVWEADVITCPTLALREYLAQFTTNIVILPNFLNDQVWATALKRQNVPAHGGHPVVIGYMGTRSHIPDLEMITPVLIRILRRYGEKIRLRFWGCPPPSELANWRNVEWLDLGVVNYTEFARYFSEQHCDIFVAPLVDSPFNNCKSALKFLEYSSLGVPGIYSAVGQFKEVVVHGENGFLADDLEDWQEYLSQLIEDGFLREQIGRQARETVSREWLLSQHAEEWLDFYNTLSASQRTNSVRITGMPASFMSRVEAWDRENLTIIDELVRESDRKEQVFIRELNEKDRVLRETEREAEKLGNQLNAILTSPGWRLVEILGRIRNWIAPFGTKREQIFFAILQRLCRPAQQEGLSSEILLTDGTPCTIPTISIILPKGGNFPNLSPVSLQEWISSQTYTNVEAIVWEVEDGIAYILDAPDKKWPAPSVSALIEGLRGKYLCWASQDLLQMPETYLEANLITLESENLIFTINLRGYSSALYKYLRSGLLPGEPCLPFLRQVVRRENIQDNFVIRLSDPAGDGNTVVGKVIVHPTNHIDQALPFNSAIQGVPLRLQGDEITLHLPGSLVEQGKPRIVHPVSTVVPLLSMVSDDRPTVFVVLPFLAVGGAERVALDVLYYTLKDMRFVVLTTDKHDLSLGTTADAFRQITPYVYTISDWLLPDLRLSFLEYLIERFQPVTIYIANGSQFIYDMIPLIKQQHPELRVVNQVYDHRMGWINRYNNKELISSVDAHIGCNQKICQAYIRHGVSGEKVHLIPHGVDVSLFDPGRYPPERSIAIKKQMGLPTAQRIITFLGRLHPQKRPLDFVEMARRFADNPALFFLIVGDGPLAGVVDAEVQRIALRNLERRSFSSAPDVLAISDVVVLPSEYEGMPLVVLEAQAMGKPVVVTDVGANREMLQMTRGGVVIPRIGDVKALVKGIEEILQNPPDPVRVRQTIVSMFSIKEIAQQYKRVFLGEQ